MKVLNKIAILFLTLSLLLVSSGCSNFNSNEKSHDVDSGSGDVFDNNTYQNEVIPIYNAANKEIGSITCFSYSAFVNGSILYTRLPENDPSAHTLEYWLYDIEAKKDYKLAVVDDWMYEEGFEAIEFEDHLYLSVSLGEYAEREKRKQVIYDIDLSEHSMSPILEIEGGIPYNSYTIANNKLILAELLSNGSTDLIEYDFNEKHDSTIVHAYDESDCFVRDSIRHIYADSENIYTVRLHRGEADNYFLYLDTYDFDYNLLNSVDIRDFCVETDIKLTEGDIINEWKQFIAFFYVHNDLIYYQNFSTTNAIGVIGDGKVNRLFETNMHFSYVNNISQSGDNDLFLQAFGDNTDYRNIFYLVNSQTQEVEAAKFFADNHNYTFRTALRDDDKILLRMGYLPYSTGERLPDCLYYIDMNDLKFKPINQAEQLRYN